MQSETDGGHQSVVAERIRPSAIMKLCVTLNDVASEGNSAAAAGFNPQALHTVSNLGRQMVRWMMDRSIRHYKSDRSNN